MLWEAKARCRCGFRVCQAVRGGSVPALAIPSIVAGVQQPLKQVSANVAGRILAERVFEDHGGELGGLSRETLARDLAAVVQPLLSTYTNAVWIEAINARFDLLERDTDNPGPRLVQFEANGVAEMTAPVR